MTANLSPRLPLLVPLLSTALLGGCAWQSEVDSLKQQNQALQQQLATQSNELAASKAQVARLQGAIKYTVNSDLLFKPGGWEMTAKGKDLIAKMAQKLAPSQSNTLLVNGYTDDAPIGPGLKKQGIASNEVLSQKRAENVREFLITQGVKPELIVAKGYGDADPVASNDTAKGRAQNRRVELEVGPPVG
jgi:chemotaxis protein MotB